MSGKGKNQTINISEFKAKALKFIGETASLGREYIITRKGVPVARVAPVKPRVTTRRGSLKGLAEIQGDIVSFDTSEDWESLQK